MNQFYSADFDSDLIPDILFAGAVPGVRGDLLEPHRVQEREILQQRLWRPGSLLREAEQSRRVRGQGLHQEREERPGGALQGPGQGHQAADQRQEW